jgi:hypothetical protein
MAYFNKAQWERLAKLAALRRRAMDPDEWMQQDDQDFKNERGLDEPKPTQEFEYTGDWTDADISGRAKEMGIEAKIVESHNGRMVKLYGREQGVAALAYLMQMHSRKFVEGLDHKASSDDDKYSPVCEEGHCARCDGKNCGCPCHKKSKSKEKPKKQAEEEKKMKCPVCGQMVWPDHTPSGPTCQKNQGLR